MCHHIFRIELNQFVVDKNLPVIGHLHSEVLDIPIYEYSVSKDRICITMPFSTALVRQGLLKNYMLWVVINLLYVAVQVPLRRIPEWEKLLFLLLLSEMRERLIIT